MTAGQSHDAIEATLLSPLGPVSRRWLAWTGVLFAITVAGFVAYGVQLRDGLAATGMGDTVIWGVYISNFVWFSGVSMAGTFISAILRITGAEWRRPLTRFSELTTVAALSMCAVVFESRSYVSRSCTRSSSVTCRPPERLPPPAGSRRSVPMRPATRSATG